MPERVIDASVAVKWVMKGESHRRQARKLLRESLVAGIKLVTYSPPDSENQKGLLGSFRVPTRPYPRRRCPRPIVSSPTPKAYGILALVRIFIAALTSRWSSQPHSQECQRSLSSFFTTAPQAEQTCDVNLGSTFTTLRPASSALAARISEKEYHPASLIDLAK
jgi:hypothetical protein